MKGNQDGLQPVFNYHLLSRIISPRHAPSPTTVRVVNQRLFMFFFCQVDREHRLTARAGEAFGGAMDGVTNAVSGKDDQGHAKK